MLILTRPAYGLAFAVALSPLTNYTVGGAKPLQVVLPALSIGLLAYLLLAGGARSGASVVVQVGVVVFVAAVVASSIQALDPAESVKKVVIVLTSAALFFSASSIAQHGRGSLNVLVGGVLAALFIASAQGVMQKYLGDTGEFGIVAGGEVVGRVQGSFGHPNQYGGFLAVLIPVAVAVLVLRAWPTKLRVFAACALLPSLPALTFSYARGAIVALVLGSLLWLAFLRPRHAVLVAIVVAVAGIALAPGALKERLDPSTSSGDITLRADIWRASIDIYADHPFLGVGLNNFAVAYETLPTALAGATQRRLLHQSQVLVPPHAQNLYLNILAELGLIGLAAFLLFAAAAVWSAYRASRAADPAERALALALGAAIFTLGVHSLLEVTLLGEVAIPLFALLGAVAVISRRERAVAREAEAEARRAASGAA